MSRCHVCHDRDLVVAYTVATVQKTSDPVYACDEHVSDVHDAISRYAGMVNRIEPAELVAKPLVSAIGEPSDA